MNRKILKKDISRNKVITATLFLFVMLAAMLAASAAGIVVELVGTIDTLLEKSAASHFVQMHSGDLDLALVSDFANANTSYVKEYQIAELLNIEGANLVLGANTASEANSIMENAFVRQNLLFDFLLDADNKIIALKSGEVAVPIYHMQQYDLQIGDNVKITSKSIDMDLTIAAFVRDAQMNPSIITSKRFLVSNDDWHIMSEAIGEIEYLVEFQLNDINRVGEFEKLYLSSGLPQSGPTVTYSLFRLLNSITDGIVAALIALISIMLVFIAALCLRFNLLAAIEEDYREIGVMKAIGISNNDIKKLYLAKYDLIALLACVVGYIISLFISDAFTANISLYMGSSDKSIWTSLLPAVGSVAILLAVSGFCRLILRRFRGISAANAMRTGISPQNGKIRRKPALNKTSFPNVNVFLGVYEVFGHFRVYGLLCVVFIICTFLMLVPLCTLNTVESPKFLTYMGVGISDIRIDLLYDSDIENRYEQMLEHIRNDDDVEKYSAFPASNYKVVNSDGGYENIRIETGDFTVFPLEYLKGAAPTNENEIALSIMNADEMQKRVGETLTVLVNGAAQEMIVCGIYQDITNGGKTAKAILPYDLASILWFTVSIDIKEGTDIPAKIAEYGEVFTRAKVADIDNYMEQTLGEVIKQLRMSARLATGISISIAILITAMFFKMLTAKDAEQIAIMRSIGFSAKNIHLQYATRALLILLIGIIVGLLSSATVGREIASLIIPGISRVRFTVNPLLAYVLCPMSIIAAVMTTIWFVGITMKKSSGFITSAQ